MRHVHTTGHASSQGVTFKATQQLAVQVLRAVSKFGHDLLLKSIRASAKLRFVVSTQQEHTVG